MAHERYVTSSKHKLKETAWSLRLPKRVKRLFPYSNQENDCEEGGEEKLILQNRKDQLVVSLPSGLKQWIAKLTASRVSARARPKKEIFLAPNVQWENHLNLGCSKRNKIGQKKKKGWTKILKKK